MLPVKESKRTKDARSDKLQCKKYPKDDGEINGYENFLDSLNVKNAEAYR